MSASPAERLLGLLENASDRPHCCYTCGRILFLTPDGVLPIHRTPQKAQRMPTRGGFGSVALTSELDPWCAGGGQPT